MRGTILVALVLWAVVSAVGCQKEPELDGRKVTEWISLLRHQDWDMQEKAADALVRLGPDALPYLKRTLKTAGPTTRRSVVVTLGKMGPAAKSAVPNLLSRLAREKVPIIRVEIIKALAAIDPRGAEVVAAFEKRKQRDVEADVRAAAARALESREAPRAPADKPGPAAPGEAQPERFELREAVAGVVGKKAPGVSFGLIAEVIREKRRAALVWPGLKAGEILDDDVVAMVFERRQDGWKMLAEHGPLRGADAAGKLAEALGGADKQRVVRPCGVAQNELAAHLARWGASFAQARKDKQDARAMEAYEQLSRVFGYSLVAFDDALVEMLAHGAFDRPWRIDCGQGTDCRAEIQGPEGEAAKRIAIRLRPCGQGMVIGSLSQQRAEPAADGGPAGTEKPGAARASDGGQGG
ncbi:MAG: HEAT repeat domain-containing protein [Deltaproteobacteria bacterium]|nr:HEAT repeat domain-containing protein [Deltaproteobacteria bacterium]